MKKFVILFCALFCASTLLLAASSVQAQTALWVSATGSDGNACSQASPCATFQGAVNKGNVGLINCLTSGNYGAVTITASIIIDCGAGNVGNIVISTGNAITINTSAGATVVLRHLSLTGLSGGTYGISGNFYSGALVVEDCQINGFLNGYGILFSTNSGRGLLQVSTSQIFGNQGGISAYAGNQIASVVLNRVELVGNQGYGIILGGPAGVIAGTMRQSIVGANGTTGVIASAGQVYFTVEESSIVDNLSYGIYSNSIGTVLNVGGSTIVGNGTGVNVSTGSIISFGNNQLNANGFDGGFNGATALR